MRRVLVKLIVGYFIVMAVIGMLGAGIVRNIDTIAPQVMPSVLAYASRPPNSAVSALDACRQDALLARVLCVAMIWEMRKPAPSPAP